MTKTKTPTEEMIAQLNAAEEVMAVLDQHADHTTPLGSVFLEAYRGIEKARDKSAEGWNGDLNPGEEKIYRCSCASNPYHTDEDGSCEVWSTDELCSLHEQQQLEARSQFEYERDEYYRAKRRGEDV